MAGQTSIGARLARRRAGVAAARAAKARMMNCILAVLVELMLTGLGSLAWIRLVVMVGVTDDVMLMNNCNMGGLQSSLYALSCTPRDTFVFVIFLFLICKIYLQRRLQFA